MERKYFFHLKALSAILLCLLIFRHSPLCAGEKPVITLGDSNKAPHLIPQVIREDLTYWHFGIDNNNAHGVLAHASKGIEGDPGRIIVVPFNGKTRELDLSKILKGYPEKIILDEEGYLFVETQVKFGCDYEVACISPRDKLLWVKSFIYSGDCKGGESWGISASLYQSASEIGVECYDRLPTGEFAMRIKKDSFRRYRLKDKLNNSWEEGREAKKKIWSEDSFRSNWYYFSIPRGMTGDGLIPYKNELNRTIGWVRLKESHNPKEGGTPPSWWTCGRTEKAGFTPFIFLTTRARAGTSNSSCCTPPREWPWGGMS